MLLIMEVISYVSKSAESLAKDELYFEEEVIDVEMNCRLQFIKSIF